MRGEKSQKVQYDPPPTIKDRRVELPKRNRALVANE